MKSINARPFVKELRALVERDAKAAPSRAKRQRNGDSIPLFAWIRAFRGIDNLLSFKRSVYPVLPRSQCAALVAERICRGKELLQIQRQMVFDHLAARYGSNRDSFSVPGYVPHDGIELKSEAVRLLFDAIDLDWRAPVRVLASQELTDQILIGACAAHASPMFLKTLRNM